MISNTHSGEGNLAPDAVGRGARLHKRPDERPPTPYELRSILEYDPDTGLFLWRPRPASLFSDAKQQPYLGAIGWNARFAGKPAFTSTNSDGYKIGRIFFRWHRAHRVAWAMFYGRWPEGEIDHINRDPSDNRICNLRLADRALNNQNRRLQVNNRSGVPGVHWSKRHQKWRAVIKVSGRKHYLGVFADFGDAVAARRAGEISFGFNREHSHAPD